MSEKPIEAFKYTHAKRAAIPSHEEAGAEAASPVVVSGPSSGSYTKNPILHRGQDPELFWLNKYGASNTEDRLLVDIRSLYRHEHIQPEMLLPSLMRVVDSDRTQADLFGEADVFNQVFERSDELSKPGTYYYKHREWTNRLIQGDSLLVMTSLLEREGMAGSMQCVYFDPPYGIRYGSNWQIKLNNRNVPDGQDDSLTGEPEQIKAFRDTWELGIHSYLNYLRDRLIVARDLLHSSGSCFVQISDENLHLVRCLMDEVFGSANFLSQISFSKSAGGLQSVNRVGAVLDYIVWYAKDANSVKYRAIYETKNHAVSSGFTKLELSDGTRRSMTKEERTTGVFPPGSKPYTTVLITKPGPGSKFDVAFNGKVYTAGNRWWGTTPQGIANLIAANRVEATDNAIRFVTYFSDFPYRSLTNLWSGFGGAADPLYVVQTNSEIVKRCILMTTDPGDLVFDPTCGSGTTAHVAEQWGRRWITVDTSRIAINVAKRRLMTAKHPYYRLYDQLGSDIRQGFIYKKVAHVTMASVANNETPGEETLYDQPETDQKRLRISGPFTVETLQSFEPMSLAALAATRRGDAELGKFEDVVFQHLKSAGVKTGDKKENAIFSRVDRLADSDLHAEGFYHTAQSEAKAYLHIGPKFGTVSRLAVNNAIKACRRHGDADWLIILGFSFESDIESKVVSSNQGQFRVTKVRMHDDLLQEGLLKCDKKAASFVTIGEPDITIKAHKGDIATVEIRGLDIYDPIKDEIKSRDLYDIAYWMVDTDYDNANFIVRQAFFCGGDRDEFEDWRKGLVSVGQLSAKRGVEKTLRIEINEEAFARLYGHESHPFSLKKGQRVAVRVVSQFGEESTKILER